MSASLNANRPVIERRLGDESKPITASTYAPRGYCYLMSLVLLCAVAVFPVRTQTFQWAHSAGGANTDFGDDIAVDPSGNSYIVGDFRGTATFGTLSLTSTDPEGALFVVKYDPSGTALWARKADGEFDQDAVIAVDPSDSQSVYVAGTFRGITQFGSFTVDDGGLFLGTQFLAKYSATGTALWARVAATKCGMGGTVSEGLAVNSAGEAYLTGVEWGDGYTHEFFLAKYDPMGNVLWGVGSIPPGEADATDVGVDASGNAYVTGKLSSSGPVTLGSVTLSGTSDFFVAKYDNAGNLVWAKSAGGIASSDWAGAIAVDGFGKCYVSGYFDPGPATFGSVTLSNTGDRTAFLVKYDAATGNVDWARSAAGGGVSQTWELAVDQTGTSYMIGYFRAGTSSPVSFGPFTLPAASGLHDIFIASYDGAGVPRWALSTGGPDDSGLVFGEAGRGIGIDGLGNVFVTGSFEGTASFGTFTLTASGGCPPGMLGCDADVFIAKINDAPVGGACSPDSDGDGIQDILDGSPGLASNSWNDNTTTPVPFGGSIVRWGGATMTVCDLPSPQGVEIENLTGPSSTAHSFCPSESMEVRSLGAGEKTRFDCLTAARGARSAAIAQATAVSGDIDVDLITGGVTIAVLTLPEGNSVQFTQATLVVAAPATNTEPLTIRNGPSEDVLGPGESTTIVDYVTIPAASPWSLLVLAILLLAGITFKFARRRAIRA